MAFLDILRSRKREEVKPERLPKGAFSPEVNRPRAEKRQERPVRKLANLHSPAAGKEEKPAAQTEQKTPVSSAKASVGKSALAAHILTRPHITERATFLSQQNVYTFRVSPDANKILVKRAVKEMYGFEPVKIRISKTMPKKRLTRGKYGVRPGFKKALVYLNKEDKIEFV